MPALSPQSGVPEDVYVRRNTRRVVRRAKRMPDLSHYELHDLVRQMVARRAYRKPIMRRAVKKLDGRL